jgi:hypothetical protein
LVSQGTPSENFLVPAKAWNSATARGTLVARNEPTQVYQINDSGTAFISAYTIARGTKVTSPTTRNSVGAGGVDYQEVTIVDGEKAGATGFVKVPDLQDSGDGAATVDLPFPTVNLPFPDVTTSQQHTPLWDSPDGKRVADLAAGTGLGRTERVDPKQRVWWTFVIVLSGPHRGKQGWLREVDIYRGTEAKAKQSSDQK